MTDPIQADLAQLTADLRAAEQAATPGRGALRVAMTVQGQANVEFVTMLLAAVPDLLAAAEAVERVRALLDLVGRLQKPDPDTGDRMVSFFAVAEALHPDDEEATGD